MLPPPRGNRTQAASDPKYVKNPNVPVRSARMQKNPLLRYWETVMYHFGSDICRLHQSYRQQIKHKSY